MVSEGRDVFLKIEEFDRKKREGGEGKENRVLT